MTVDPHDDRLEGSPRPGDEPRPPEDAADDLADEVIDDLASLDPGDGADPADPFELTTDPDETNAALGRLRADATDRGEKQDATRSFWRELPILVLVALVVAVLIKTFLVQAFYIPSGSMEETLMVGDRVMVNKLSYVFGSPQRGDVIVFDNPEHTNGSESLLGAITRHVGESLGISSPDSALIKRVIGVGGDTVEIRNNRVLVNGEAIDEPYLGDNVDMPDFGPVTVPDGELFVMGDNRSRNGSSDSRHRLGTVPEDGVIGRAFVKVWPPGRWGGL
ncbi:MAG: signal peptidase I [Actinobacteria bacterium]|nr:signal peptidase I [Actinomycetota bacterium]